MASISSIISLVVLLLATYCYSVPIKTDYDYTTSGYEFTTGKSMAERESMPFTLPEEYTTGHSIINHKRASAGKKDDSDSDSDELTTVYSTIKDGQQKRDTSDEVTSSPFEATSMISKRSDEHEHSDSDSDEMTTQRSMIKDGHQKRDTSDEVTSSPFEATSASSMRSADTEITGEYTTERSHAVRDLEMDSFTTLETSTEFNNRVGQMGERESVDLEMTTEFEPTTSVDMEKPTTYYRKTETIVPGKITKTEITSDGEHQSYTYKEMPIEHQVSSFSEGTTEESDSKTNADH